MPPLVLPPWQHQTVIAFPPVVDSVGVFIVPGTTIPYGIVPIGFAVVFLDESVLVQQSKSTRYRLVYSILKAPLQRQTNVTMMMMMMSSYQAAWQYGNVFAVKFRLEANLQYNNRAKIFDRNYRLFACVKPPPLVHKQTPTSSSAQNHLTARPSGPVKDYQASARGSMVPVPN
jgi:hypothetical protein